MNNTPLTVIRPISKEIYYRFPLFLIVALLTFKSYSQNCTVNAGGNVVVCGTTTTLTGTVTGIVGAGTPLWTFVSGPGPVPVIVTPTALVTNVTGMSNDGVYTFQLARNCGTGISTDQVSITAHPSPPGFTAGPDITGICATVGSTALAGVIPAGYTGVWTSENIYSLNRYGTSVSSNSTFSSTTVANPTFSLISTSNHDIDPAYNVDLTITSMDGVCSFTDQAVVSFCPNPALIPASPYEFCGTGTIFIDLDANSPDMSSNPAYNGAGSTASVTYTVNTVSKPGGAGVLSFSEIEGDRVYLNGFSVVGTYVFSITVSSPCCGAPVTTSNITVNVNPPSPSDLDFNPSGLHPEQMTLYSYGGSAGEVHCGIAGIATPEPFYFNINPLDPPSTVVSVFSGGILSAGASVPTVTVTGGGTMNRVASVDPGVGGWKVGTYMFFVITGTWPCEVVNSYYIHISDGNRPPIAVPDISVCYMGAPITVTVTEPAVFQGVVDPSYFQDFSGRWDYAVVSKPTGSGNPVFDSYSNREITNPTALISNLDTPGDYVFTITANSGNGAGNFLEAEYACSGISAPLSATFTVHIENFITANAGSSQSLGCTSSIFLLGNSPGAGTGLWTNVSSPMGSTPVIPSPNSPSTIPNSLTVAGAYTFKWTITSQYGSCSSNANITFTISAVSPDVPLIGTIVQPTCTVSTGSVSFTGLPVGSWTLTATNASAATFNLPGSGTTGTFPGLAPGTYTFTVSDGTCSSLPTVAVVINPQPVTPTAPTITAITQPTCTVATGSIDIGGLPASGAWTATISPGGTSVSGVGPVTTATFPGLGANTTYTIVVLGPSGCTSVASANAVLIAQPTTPSVPVVGMVAQPTCTVATGSVAFSGLPAAGTWTISSNPVILPAPSGTGTTGTFSGLTSNTYIFTVTNASGCTSSVTSSVTINVQPPTPSVPVVGTITQPTCTVATGSVDFSGLPAAGTWTISSNPVILPAPSGTGTTGTFSGLTPNTYTFTVTNVSGCTSSVTSSVTINVQPPTPSVPVVGTVTQPTCTVATGSVAFSGLPAAGTWTISSNPVILPAPTGTGTTTTYSGLTPNTYTFTVTNASGCTSSVTSSVTINVQPPTPSIPVVGTITQPTCTVTKGSVDFSGLPAAGVWTITSNPAILPSPTGTGTTSTFSGLTPNTYVFTVTNASGCTSSVTSSVTINVQPPTPSVPVVGTITQPTCTVATGSVDFSGLPAAGTWTIASSPAILPSPTGTGTTGKFSGLTPNSYTFTVTNASGCTSSVTSSVTINVQPPTPSIPVVGTITQPTCTVATGSVDFSGLPAAGTWTIVSSPAILPSPTSTGTTGAFSGLTPNTYTFTVTNASGCTSSATSSVTINAQPPTPSIPVVGTITQPTCSVTTGSVDFSGLPVAGIWTITSSPVILPSPTGTGTTATFSGLTPNTYTFTVTNASGCTSSSTSSVTLSVPVAPTLIFSFTNPTTCGGNDGEITIAGLDPTTTYDLNYIDNTGTPMSEAGVSSNSSGQIILSNLSAGTYNNFDLMLNSCSSLGVGAVLISPPAPSIDVIPPVTVCDSFILATITGANLTGSEAYFSGPGGTGTQFNSGDVVYSGSTTLYMYDINGSCSSDISLSITVNPSDDAGFTVSNYCEGGANVAQISGTTGGVFSFNPMPADGATINSVTGAITNGVGGTSYTIQYTTGGVCPSVSQQVVTVYSIPNLPVTSMSASYCSDVTPSVMVVTAGFGDVVTWYSDNSLNNQLHVGDSLLPGNSTATYYVTETSNGCESSAATITITIQNCSIVIPTAFTPDNDGVNDTWVLENIDSAFPKNQVRLFNRWGTLVYESPVGAYESNSWDGTYKGKVLPVESFYFMIEFNDGKKDPAKGTVSIILK